MKLKHDTKTPKEEAKMDSARIRSFRTLLLAAGAATLLIPYGAFAAMTKPCTVITNTATVAYTVNNVSQGTKTSPSDTNNTFNVGAKILFSVTEKNSATYVGISPSTTAYGVLKFEVKNDSNTNLNFALASEALGSVAEPAPFTGTDSFNGSTIAVKVENGTNTGFLVGEDTATSITNLASDGVGIATVYITYKLDDLQAANNAIAGYFLKATAKWLNDDAITVDVNGKATPIGAQVTTCNGAKEIDVVFGDGDGTATGDANRDGIHSDYGAYKVATATIGVAKTFEVVYDPINCSAYAFPTSTCSGTPKAIPGAVIRYQIVVTNSGGSAAILSALTDTLNTDLTIDSAVAHATWSVTGGRTANSGTLTADANNADGLDFNGGILTHTLTTFLGAQVVAPLYDAGELKATDAVTLKFDATVK